MSAGRGGQRTVVVPQLPVHLTLLRLSCPLVDWRSGGSPLDGLPDPVVRAALHCAYADCLPPGTTEETARSCLELLGPPVAGFERLIALCRLFLHNAAVRQRKDSYFSLLGS